MGYGESISRIMASFSEYNFYSNTGLIHVFEGLKRLRMFYTTDRAIFTSLCTHQLLILSYGVTLHYTVDF